MPGFSPTAYLLWSVLACLFEGFLVVHLYFYDKFQCVKWGSGKQPGAFKRVMTYSYLATVPLLMIFNLTMTVSSYQQGFMLTPKGHVIQLDFSGWTHPARNRLLPMFFVLASAWAFELVTHLEELTFWLFLLHQGPSKRDWFSSWEFRVWYLGSVIALLGMPLTVIIKRANLDLCFAWIFIAGSAAGLFTTLCFIYVLVLFPRFIHRVKQEGAEPEVVVRLTIFYQLNITRIIFRFIFHLPLLILALDSLRGPHRVVQNAAASDLLVVLGGIGCFVSSAITLFIFFPRSITRESGYRVKISTSQTVDSHELPTRPSSLPDYHDQHDQRDQNISPKSTTPTALGAFRHRRHHTEGQVDQPVETVRPESDYDYDYDGEATPQYESDPESNCVHSPLSSPQGRSTRSWVAEGNDDGLAWEMRSDESTGVGAVSSPAANAQQQQHNRTMARQSQNQQHSIQHSRSRKGRKRMLEEQPSIGSIGSAMNAGMSKNKRKRSSLGKDSTAGIVVIPHIPRVPPSLRQAAMLEDATTSSSRPASIVHPYAMNFTSPIDLCDPEDESNFARAM
ncbi:hypothetical protein D9757_006817 [Collybiopsis confluens]|uniref:Transmembrane protein n=1 Tax=Collybiopsis confluens TaxID=2823264 RepID=A0A8H5MAX6_9AGAR|nr:hypothetical protein D9757_006817 [Collybiopsis confluens]